MSPVEQQALTTASNIANTVSVTIVFIICIVHSFRLYQDLYTIERKSVLHRRWLPKNEKYYKLIAWFTLLSVVSSMLSIIFVRSRVINETDLGCMILNSLGFSEYVLGKLFMFWTFLFRLRTTFEKTAFAYKPFWLNFWTMFFLCYAIINIVFGVLTAMSAGCSIKFNAYGYIYIGMSVVQEVLFSVGFLIAFILPLRGIKRCIDGNRAAFTLAIDKHQRKKIYFSAVKITTLTSVDLFSTIFVFGFLIALRMSMWWLDLMINTVCLFLMTPYYDDAIYYQNICWCCVKCFTPKNRNYRSRLSVDYARSRVPTTTADISEDTMDQIKVCAQDATVAQIAGMEVTVNVVEKSYSITPIVDNEDDEIQ